MMTRLRSPRVLGSSLGVLLLTCVGSYALAEEPVDPAEARKRAKGYFQAGSALYNAGDYASAMQNFEKAYELTGYPDLLYNMGKTASKMGKPADAVRYLVKYRTEKPDAPDREGLDREIAAQQEAALAQQEARKKAEEEAAAKEAERKQAAAAAALAKAPPPPPPKPQKPWAGPPWPALAMAGGGVVFLAIGIGLGASALSTANTAVTLDRYDPALDARGRSMDSAGIAFDVLGGLALAGGVAWTGVWYFRDRKKTERPKAVWSPARSPAWSQAWSYP